jgi:phosphotransferase system enzyme I (PtsP)
MFPLVGAPDEFLAAKEFVADCAGQLAKEGIPHNASPRLGIMVELPSAVELIDELAELADFLSIGTNDLVQYLLAADRTNQAVTDYYVPYHPAVLRALHRIAEGAARQNCPLSICGEMGGDPRFLAFLLGIGVRRFSVDARRLPSLQRAVETISLADARAFAERALRIRSVKEAASLFSCRRKDDP